MEIHQNIFLTDTLEPNVYKPINARGGKLNLPNRDRNLHANHLIDQYKEAFRAFEEYQSTNVLAKKVANGTFLEFSGAENCDLVTKSLENATKGIRVLNIRDKVDIIDEKEVITTKATVYIPNGQENYFLDRIIAYASEDIKSGKPKYNDFIVSVEKITSALKISSVWIGNSSHMPNEEFKWYEIWIDINEEPNDISKELFEKNKNEVFSNLDQLGIEHRSTDEYIHFPERLVILVKANEMTILDMMKQGIKVAEVRRPSEPNRFWGDEKLFEQHEWKDDLINRTRFIDTGVAVCVLDTGVEGNHPLITPYMIAPGLTINSSWGASDHDGHGTNMAGVILYNDLKRYLMTSDDYYLHHSLESVKMMPPIGSTPVRLYGNVTEQAVLIPQIEHPRTERVYCMAITDADSGLNNGQPSSWSAKVDEIIYKQKKLMLVSAGNNNFSKLTQANYVEECINKSVEDPAQAWNCLSIGAYSGEDSFTPTSYTKGFYPVAKIDEMSPYNSTSIKWENYWPIKPELVCDGGNMLTDGRFYTSDDDLSKLTLSNDIKKTLFDYINATSAATAQCSCIAGELLAAYPSMWPETLRGLLVHSAKWTEQMINQFSVTADLTKKKGIRNLLRSCGYGVPNLERARDSLNNCVNMIIEDEIQPYEKIASSEPKMKEVHYHALPWPKEELIRLENTPVKLRVTLSYFIEPGPGEKGWKNKYRYASCGLRFDIKRPTESEDQFRMRVNGAMRDENYQRGQTNSKWYLGSQNRDVGSIHSDYWEDSAIELSQCDSIAVYPVVGWWKERKNLKKYNTKIKYSLIVSIETPEENVDLYTPITNKIASRIPVTVDTNN